MGIDLTGKVVIVTGGAKGIGQGCVTKFVESNAKVIIFDIDTDFANPKKSVYTWNVQQHYSIDAFIEGKVAMMFKILVQFRRIFAGTSGSMPLRLWNMTLLSQ